MSETTNELREAETDPAARSSGQVESPTVTSGSLPDEPESEEDADEHGRETRGPRTPEWEAEQKAIAHSDEHLMTHLPKNDYCEWCRRAKVYKWPARRKAHSGEEELSAFGQCVTCDHVICKGFNSMGVDKER